MGPLVVFAEEGLKKEVGLINGGFWVGLKWGGAEYFFDTEHTVPCFLSHQRMPVSVTQLLSIFKF